MERNEDQPADGPNVIPRRRYERPAIDESADFETLALTCGKFDASCKYTAGGTSNS